MAQVNKGRTWFIDFDGVIVEHHGTKLLPGVKEFFKNIPDDDTIIITTGRSLQEVEPKICKRFRELFKRDLGLLVGLPCGERILINDIKPPMKTARAVNVERNKGLEGIEID